MESDCQVFIDHAFQANHNEVIEIKMNNMTYIIDLNSMTGKI